MNIVIAGDFNEFVHTGSVLTTFDDILTNIDESPGLDPVGRYAYIFDQNCQQLQQLVRVAQKGQEEFES